MEHRSYRRRSVNPFTPSRIYQWICDYKKRNLGNLNLTENEWKWIARTYAAKRWHSHLIERESRALSRHSKKKESDAIKKRGYTVSKEGILAQHPLNPLKIYGQLYKAECAWAILCGEAKGLNKRTTQETVRVLRKRYHFLPQTKRQDLNELLTLSPREWALKELSEELNVKEDSLPVLLSPSAFPKSKPKWLKDIETFQHPTWIEFDPPIRLRRHRPRWK